MTYTNTAQSDLERLLTSAKAAQELAAEMVASKTEIDGGMEAVARGLADAGKAAELAVKQQRGRDLVNSVMRLGSSEDFTDDGRPATLFDEQAKNGIIHAVKTRTSFRAELPSKAALGVTTVLPPSGSYVEGGLHPNSQFPLASLFRNVPADGPVQRFYQGTSGAAAVVAEGALKPDSGIAFAAVDLPIAKIACTAQFTDEMADDAPFLVAFLQQELAAAVAAAENAAILDTFGTTSGVLTAAGDVDTVVDILADEIGHQEAISGKTPTAVIANPTVVATIRKAKAVTAGTYVLDPLTSGPTSIHGVRVISSPATPAGTAWVVDASSVLIYRRSNLTVEVGTNADDLVKNTKTAVAEERMAAAVVRPTGLIKVTLT